MTEDQRDNILVQSPGYSLRPRKKRTQLPVVASADCDIQGSDRFSIEDEARAWDAFYKSGKNSDDPFSGFDTKATVSIIRYCLRKVWRSPLIDSNDVILEVGHGKHPLLWDFKRTFLNFRYYIGVEFSKDSIHEAIKLRQRLSEQNKAPPIWDNVEFLSATDVNYFEPDGSCNAEVVLPPENTKPWVRAGYVTLLLAKSTLDYITCRLTGSVDSMDWADQPRIAPSVVKMFDAFSLALGEPDEEKPPTIIFVEPGDFVKFRDHIATITRVIYAATFRTKSPARWLRLKHVFRHKNHKAVSYTLHKTFDTYSSYDDIRDDMYRVTKGLYELSEWQDNDWLLPMEVPPKWNSDRKTDLEQLSSL
ncbi:hypothetical protein BgAZ_300470 [Babesia gibsoni]|uniref:Uncharacterized protein n=1 Tax=Babesia gibsoni TaxID=33632 RepID=A0AAD8LHX6_BABGI|nr:hypothetical protein BgAZ_300470 [Babesia gibsoni]